MLVRQFSSSARRHAVSRVRYAAKPAPAASAASGPTTTTTSGPASGPTNGSANGYVPRTTVFKSAPARPAARPAPRVAPPRQATQSSIPGARAARPEPTAAAAAPAFEPRLVPDLKTEPSKTSVWDTVDPDEVVDSVENVDGDIGAGSVSDWTTSFQGLGSASFDDRAIDILLAPLVPEDIEITPDGLLYLPEIKYRRILNRAFGPGAWGIAPRSKTLITQRQVTREYALVCLGRLVSVSRGEQDYFNAEGVTTAMEGCKSNALMRCCKDLGIASELWDPTFIRQFKSQYCDSKFYEKKRRFVWKRKDRQWEYPYNQS